MVTIENNQSALTRIAVAIMLSLYFCESISESGIKYILQWTPLNTVPFPSMGNEREAFINKKCLDKNCFVTNNQLHLDDITKFDAIVFNVVELRTNTSLELPVKRSQEQKYILVSRESSVYYPLPSRFDGYFNWTWTFRLDSDISFKYVTVRDKSGHIIGPKINMHWKEIDGMKPITKYVKRKLRSKNLAAVWFASNCNSSSKRETFIFNLQKELGKYGLDVDIYGSCGEHNCPRDGWEQECHALIESDYYFYLAFENSFDEDYVTEKLLTALEHFAVPVVLGGANYTRFMPDGIYLNACSMGYEILAEQINRSVKNKEVYYEYFKWHNYYSFHDASEDPDSDGVCELCALLNSKTNNTIIVNDFSKWWNESHTSADVDSCVKNNNRGF